MATYYVVTESVPGYLPTDDDPYTTTNRREAESVAAEMARELIRFERFRKSGSAREGLIRLTSNRENDLGIVIEIHAEGEIYEERQA
jgi:hypothetical protein